MEKYIQDIEYIHQYINNSLSNEERKAFEEQLESNTDFKALYEEHLTFLGGLERIELKQEIRAAHKGYLTSKWIKYLVISAGVIGLSIGIYSLISKEDVIQTTPTTTTITTQIQQTTQEEDVITSILVDSIDTPTDTKIEVTNNSTSIDQENPDTLLYTEDTIKTNPLQTLPKKDSKEFIINTQRDTVILGKEGTKLTIKANSFKYAGSDKTATGIVTVSLSEYYQLSDILLANLTTTSNDQLLETGGMLYLEASAGEALLELDKDIAIEIPTTNKKEDMQLFTGQETTEGINWILDNASEVVDVDELFKEIANVPFAIIDEVPSFPECQGMNSEDTKNCVTNVFQRIVNRSFNVEAIQRSTEDTYLRVFTSFTIDTNGDIIKISSRPVFPGIQEEVERVLGLVPSLSPGKQRGIPSNTLYSLPITIRFDETTPGRRRNSITRDSLATRRIINTSNRDTIRFQNSTRRSPAVINDTVFYGARTVVEDIKEILHNNNIKVDSTFVNRYENYKKKRLIQERRIKGERYVFIRKAIVEDPNSGFTILPTDSITRGGNVIRKRWNETQIPDRQFARLVPRVLGATNYLFTASRLGWINCDRFVRNNSPKIKFKIKIKDSDGADVKMVFKNIRSLLTGIPRYEGYDFGSIPKGEDVTLVAIKIVDNQYQLAIKDMNTERIEELDLEFKSYTVKELQNELKKLNSSF